MKTKINFYPQSLLLLICLLLASMVFYANTLVAASPLDINTATAEQFTAIMSGVGQAKGQAIVAYREQHGDFSRVDDLIFVKGIGPALLEKNRVLLSVGEGEEFEPQLLNTEPQ